ncbi:MAG: hypothetical protein IE909_01390 [Campylobacterales bacterium]|nr:hypothetical protein [Campylobacterales bacterium]
MVDIVDQDVTLRVSDVQKYLIADLQHAILSSSFLHEDIYAYLKSINHEKNLITFTGLKYISSYIHHRKNLRVEPDKNFILSCSSNNGYKIFPLINISNEYALIKVENLNELFQINSELKLNFSFDMPLQSFIHKHIDCKAIVVDQFAFQGFHKVLFSLQLDFEQKQLLESYIYKRSLQIITELKKNYSKLNNRCVGL